MGARMTSAPTGPVLHWHYSKWKLAPWMISHKYVFGWHMHRHELTDNDHAELLDFLCNVAGMVVLSGYDTTLYNDMLLDWHRFETETFADGAHQRTEVLWLNPAAAEQLRAQHHYHQTSISDLEAAE